MASLIESDDDRICRGGIVDNFDQAACAKIYDPRVGRSVDNTVLIDISDQVERARTRDLYPSHIGTRFGTAPDRVEPGSFERYLEFFRDVLATQVLRRITQSENRKRRQYAKYYQDDYHLNEGISMLRCVSAIIHLYFSGGDYQVRVVMAKEELLS